MFFRDMIKGIALAVVIGPPIVAAIIVIVQNRGSYLAIYLWGFVFVLSLVMMTLHPVLIAPLFNKFTPLPDGELRTKIESLASSLKFPLKKLFVVDGSTRSSHSNSLVSTPSEMERSGLDLSLLFDMMGPQEPAIHMPQQPLISNYGQYILDAETQPSLISLSSELRSEKPFFIGDLGHGSEIPYDMYHLDDRVSLSSSGTETEDIFSTLYEIYSSKNSIKWKKQQMLVPYFDRRAKKSTRIDVTRSSAKQSLNRRRTCLQ